MLNELAEFIYIASSSLTKNKLLKLTPEFQLVDEKILFLFVTKIHHLQHRVLSKLILLQLILF